MRFSNSRHSRAPSSAMSMMPCLSLRKTTSRCSTLVEL
jgi:hypothetical protein